MKHHSLSSKSLADDLTSLYYASDDIDIFCDIVARLISEHVKCRVISVVFKPLTFRKDAFVYPPEPVILKCAQYYVNGGYKDDIWVQRSPIHPKVKCIRHSDYTPEAILRETPFYENLLAPVDCLYGASIAAWQGNEWLAMATIFKTTGQGDFTDDEVNILTEIQPHFSKIINRLSHEADDQLRQQSIQAFCRYLPSAFLLLKFDLKLLQYNDRARNICHELATGTSAKLTKPGKTPPISSELHEKLSALREDIIKDEDRLSRQKPKKIVFRSHMNPSLEYRCTYVPEQSIRGMHEGLFLVVFEEVSDTINTTPIELSILTEREKKVAELMILNLSNSEIAAKLNKSVATIRHQVQSILKKLQLKNRHQISKIT